MRLDHLQHRSGAFSSKTGVISVCWAEGVHARLKGVAANWAVR